MSTDRAELDAREQKLESRERIVAERERALNAWRQEDTPAYRAAQKALDAREQTIKAREDELRRLERQLEQRIHQAKAAEAAARDAERVAQSIRAISDQQIRDAQIAIDTAQHEQARAAETIRQAALRLAEVGARETLLKQQGDTAGAAAVTRDQEFATRAKAQRDELDAYAASLERLRVELAEENSRLLSLSRLLTEKRTPELDARDEALQRRQHNLVQREVEIKAIADAQAVTQAAQEQEGKRLKAMEEGLESRTLLVERREAEAESKRQDADNVLRTAKAKGDAKP